MIKKYINRLKLHQILVNSAKPNYKLNSDIKTPISNDLQNNLKVYQDIFRSNSDVNIRTFYIGKHEKEAFIINVEGISNKTTINENILGALMTDFSKTNTDSKITLRNLKENVLTVYDIKELSFEDDVIDAALSGNCVLFIDGDNAALSINTHAWEHRGVELPQTENVIRGPQEGFCETLNTNTALIRRKIRHRNLKMEIMKIGHTTLTDVCITYIEGIAEKKVVDEVKRRLKAIHIDGVIESGYIEEFIEDSATSPFPTVGNTEKPDKLAAKILEGRVGILVDGTPVALSVPYLFIESIQSSEDYYSRSFTSSMIRILRFVSLHLSIYLPALYVAISQFHPNIIPMRLLVTMQVTRQGIPFPAAVEALIMSIMFEIMKEAGVRMPRAVGQAVSIVGALILGEVAVNAGLASPLMVMLTAATGIMSFLIPTQIGAVTLLRYPILIIASVLGLFGVIWSYLMLIVHLCALRSFGSYYLSPIAPLNVSGLKDSLIRVPWWIMRLKNKDRRWNDS